MLCGYCGHRPVQHIKLDALSEGIKELPQKKARGQHGKAFECESQDKQNTQEFTFKEEDHESELKELEVNRVPACLTNYCVTLGQSKRKHFR